MENIPRKTVVDTLETAKDYLGKLEELVASVEEAELQIITSSEKALGLINEKFNFLQAQLIEKIERRRKILEGKVKKNENHGLEPLAECKLVILARVKMTEMFISELKEVMRVGGFTTGDSRSFDENSAMLGSLPAVPDLELVPNISFKCRLDGLLADAEEQIGNVGCVSRMGPVQISCIEEKPGAVLVHWEQVDLDLQGDIQYYKLQLAHGDLKNKEHLDGNFHDVYTGPDTDFICRDLKCNVDYSFRISCTTDLSSEWSAWSLVKVTSTRMNPYIWGSNPDYKLSNDDKLATKVNSEVSVLFSKSAQISSGGSVEFSVVQCKDGLSEEGVALSTSTGVTNLVEEGVFFCNTEGKIFIDGVVKLTSLPRLVKGSKLTFSCTKVDDGRIRVSVDCGAKAVTYDWKVSSEKLFFAALFIQPGFKLLVL